MASNKPLYNVNEAEQLFEKFIKDYDRKYKDEADKEVHYQAFVKSLHKINKLNAESQHATFDINKFADYTEEEMGMMHGLKRPTTQPEK